MVVDRRFLGEQDALTVRVGAVLDRLSADLSFCGAQAGILTTLPVAAFAAYVVMGWKG